MGKEEWIDTLVDRYGYGEHDARMAIDDLKAEVRKRFCNCADDAAKIVLDEMPELTSDDLYDLSYDLVYEF